MAMVIMGANIAGIYGAQIFRSDDSPRYRRAFGVNIAVLAVGVTLAVVRFLDDKIRRKKTKNALSEEDSGSGSEVYSDGVVKVAVPADEQPQPIALSGRRASLSKADI